MFGLITRCFLKEITSKVVERLLFLYAKLNPGQGYVTLKEHDQSAWRTVTKIEDKRMSGADIEFIRCSMNLLI